MGGPDQLYLKLNNSKLIDRAATHHGQLLPEERQLVESLYKRKGALSVLVATPTLGQGMNLPADLVIIAEDSQFDSSSGRKDLLKPEDLLNAAGRAGRAGESATGIVLVVPGKVVGLDDAENKIGARWARLRDIFGQSDQCLVLDDPFTALMDRIHDQKADVGDLERYVVARLAETDETEDGQVDVRLGLSRSFAAFRKRQSGEHEWVVSRTAAALSLLKAAKDGLPIGSLSLRNIASMLGMPEDVLRDLATALSETGFGAFETVAKLREWMFGWLSENPRQMMRLIKPEGLEYLFGSDYKSLEDEATRVSFAVPRLRAALDKWMDGAPLNEIQKELSEKARDRKRSTSARKFVIRLVPDLAHLLGAPLQILQHHINLQNDEPFEPSPALVHANRCARRGYAHAEMAAFSTQVSSAGWARREIHRRFSNVTPYLKSGTKGESVQALAERVEAARNAELNNRSFSDLI